MPEKPLIIFRSWKSDYFSNDILQAPDVYTEPELAEGARRATMAQLAEWTLAADKVLVF